MARAALIIGHVKDIDGAAWDVREKRPTKHGFHVLMGWPKGCRGPGFGGPRVVPTKEIDAYFKVRKLRRDGSLYDLPVGRSTVKRIRRVLGHDFYQDNLDWWLERIQDLFDLPGVKFSQLHGVNQSIVSEMRCKFIGRRVRKPFWYREESIAQLLVSDLPRAYVADRLDISIGTLGRLRWMLRKEQNCGPNSR